MAGKFVLKRSGEQFMFNLLAAGNGEVILTSERYTRKESALAGIKAVQRHAALDAQYQARASLHGQPYFVLRSPNHEVLGTSEMYGCISARNTGVNAVKTNAPGALVDDLT